MGRAGRFFWSVRRQLASVLQVLVLKSQSTKWFSPQKSRRMKSRSGRQQEPLAWRDRRHSTASLCATPSFCWRSVGTAEAVPKNPLRPPHPALRAALSPTGARAGFFHRFADLAKRHNQLKHPPCPAKKVKHAQPLAGEGDWRGLGLRPSFFTSSGLAALGCRAAPAREN